MGEAGRRPVHDDVAKRVLNNEDTPTGGGYTPGEMRTMKDHATNYERGIEDYKAGIVFNDLENDRMYQLGRRKAQSDEQGRIHKKTATGAFDIPAADKPQVVASNPECRNDHTPRLKHTPGPWIKIGRIIDSDSHREGPHVLERICIVDDGPTEDESKANAALIAAAPELLKALKALVNVCPECNGTGVYFPRKDPITGHKEEAPCQWCKHARAAITKATGQEGHQ